jgi:N-glycosylase/DNA lyase
MPRAARALDVPADFDFAATAYSHGWCVLAPFAWDDAARVLQVVLRVPGGSTRVAFAQPGGTGAPLRADVVGGVGARAGLDPRQRLAIGAAATRMLGLDKDLGAFRSRCRKAGGTFARAAGAGFGRLLRAPSLFEDVVKILATTNTTWGGTKSMVTKLVTIAGTGGAFPTARQVAAVGARRLEKEARWGYRSAYLADFAKAVADGTLDLLRWEKWDGSTEALAREIRAVPGLGPYAVAHVLALLHRHDRIGVDTVFRSFVHRKYFPRAAKPPADRRLLAVYDAWGPWRGLAYWADLWHEHRFDKL